MTNRKELLREFLLMNLGTLLVSVGVYFFKFPNHFSMGGVSGLAVLLGKLLPQLSPLPSTPSSMCSFWCWAL
ncbi:MAG: YitT family protein [Flavonifractor plautii]